MRAIADATVAEVMIAVESFSLLDLELCVSLSAISQVGAAKDGSNVSFPQQLRSRKSYLRAVKDERWRDQRGVGAMSSEIPANDV